MSYSAKTIFVFGSYLFSLGLILLLAPNMLLVLFQMPPTSEVWVHVVGMLILFIAIYYIVAARAELLPIMVWTVWLRISVFFFFCGFVLVGLAKVALILFGAIDLAGAAWTWNAIRKETLKASGTRNL